MNENNNEIMMTDEATHLGNTGVDASVLMAWVAMSYGIEITEEEANLLLGYVEGHGYGAYLDDTDTIILLDLEDPDDGDIVASGIEELVECVSTWNEEFLQDSEVQGTRRDEILQDAEMIDAIIVKLDN